ncbi:APC family permease [Saccharopolyspora rosea]|uniref:Amino acid permease n=1 Tax=Saccharopolyspora rosea TaxID=524884 RepID=A0ABW3FQ59_9PSEU|nr:amino acid permease [Saccharopolyspora rosea]
MTGKVDSPRRLSAGTGAVPLALGGMLGAGVFAGPALAAAAAGPWWPLGLLLGALTAACAASSTAHQSTSYRGGGAVHACVRSRMGLVPARIAASAHLAGHVGALAAVAGVLGGFVAPGAPSRAAAVAILLVVLASTAGLRIRGGAAWLWLAVTLAVLALVVAVCFAIEPVPAAPSGRTVAESAVGTTGGAGVLFFAFLGFERLTAPADEHDRVAWTAVRRGAMTGIAGVCVALVVVTAALVHQLGVARLALSPTPILDVLGAAAASGIAPLVSAGAAVALLPVLLGVLEAQRSTALAVADDGDLPKGLARKGRHGTPYVLDVCAGVAAVVVSSLVEPTSAMAFAACCMLVHYAFANAGARVLLSEDRTWPTRMACLGMGLSVVLAMSLPVPAMLATLAVVIIGPVAMGLVSRRWS